MGLLNFVNGSLGYKTLIFYANEHLNLYIENQIVLLRLSLMYAPAP